MYKNDLKRGNDKGKHRDIGMRRVSISPTPFEMMQMRSAEMRSESSPMMPHIIPSKDIGYTVDNAEQAEEKRYFEKDETEKEEKDYFEESESKAGEENKINSHERNIGLIDMFKEQNAPICRDELLIGALLAFLLFSDRDNDIVLIGILIFLLI